MCHDSGHAASAILFFSVRKHLSAQLFSVVQQWQDLLYSVIWLLIFQRTAHTFACLESGYQ